MEPLPRDQKASYNFSKMLANWAFQSESCKGKYYLKQDDSIKEIMEYLNSLEYEEKNKTNITRKKSLEINREFFENYVRFHDILHDFGKYADYINPLDIKPTYSLQKDHGSAEIIINKYSSLVIGKIKVSKNVSDNLPGIYAHELTHTQLEINPRYYYTNYFLREALCIFLEKVVTYEMCPENLDSINDMRKKYLKYAFTKYDSLVWTGNFEDTAYDARSYIVSTLVANHLFYIYINSSKKVQRNILDKINDIFQGEATVDELFESRKINYANSKTLKYIR